MTDTSKPSSAHWETGGSTHEELDFNHRIQADPPMRRLPNGEPSGGVEWEKAMQANEDEVNRRKAADQAAAKVRSSGK